MFEAQTIYSQNEPERIAALENYNIMDTEAEANLDALTRLASYICETPISLITLLDMNRQWFKSRIGLDVPETPRNISFCQHAIQREGIFEVENALEDARFAENPLVLGNPNIRFYAGYPLTTPAGVKLGTLCVIDTKPRQLSPEQKDALTILAQEVVTHFELRLQKKILEHDKIELNIMNAALQEQKELILNQKSELYGLNSTLNTLIEQLANDLRTPLGQISGIADLIKMDGENLSQQQQEDLELLTQISLETADRVDRMLQVQTVHLGKIDPNLQQIDISVPTEFVLRNLEGIFIEKNISMKLRAGTPLNPIITDGEIYAKYLTEMLSCSARICPPNSEIELFLFLSEEKLHVEIISSFPEFFEQELSIILSTAEQYSATAQRDNPLVGFISRARIFVNSLAGDFHCQVLDERKILFTAQFPIR